MKKTTDKLNELLKPREILKRLNEIALEEKAHLDALTPLRLERSQLVSKLDVWHAIAEQEQP